MPFAPLFWSVSIVALGLCLLLCAVSERIMRFVQCSADVGELERVRQCRDQRASLRAEGLRLIRVLVTAAASPPAKVIAHSSNFLSSTIDLHFFFFFFSSSGGWGKIKL